ncbi:MAG TPA: PAS domain S-box protein, partial [Chitinophagaceae bacterium]|nr:PAS domain S-box protein [Chitinophagaceae bacterium]
MSTSKDTAAEWAAKELYYRDILDESTDLIFLTNMEGRVLDMNKTLCHNLGYTREELLEKNIGHIVDPGQVNKIPSTFNDLRAGIPGFCHCRFICKDGHPIELEINVKPFRSNIVLVVARDITLQLKAEKEKEAANYMLNERIKEFTTLYRAGQVLLAQPSPVKEVLQQLVNVFPAGWQYPEVTAARILFGDKEFATDNYMPTSFMQRACFKTSGGEEG